MTQTTIEPGDAKQSIAAADVQKAATYSLRPDGASAMLGDKLPQLVKGAGYIGSGNRPLNDEAEIFSRAFDARQALLTATKQGLDNPGEVRKSLNPTFSAQFGAFLMQNPSNRWASDLVEQVNSALADIGKSITLTSPLSSGFVPFDLVAPSRLIYPVYSPIRNKIPRVPGQGTSRRAKIVTGITGSQTGSSGGKFTDISIAELVQSGQSSIQSANWPLNLPGQGAQDAVDIDVPYKFFGLTESISWLAQFSGQGFEDISALANLVLLQEFMLNEEAADLVATPSNLSTPSAPTVTARTAGTGETALSVTSGNIYVVVTAVNWYGETVASSAGNATLATNTVVDVVMSPVAGAQWYNIYVGTGTANPSSHFVMASGVGGVKYTLQGTIPTSGTTPPTADTGTGSSNRMVGMLPTLSGQQAGGVYPSGWQAGYYDGAIGKKLSIAVINTALQALWNGSGVASSKISPLGAYRSDPSELIGEGSDLVNLSNDIVNAPSGNLAYRLFVDQNEVGGIRGGAAVSEFQNPITRSVVRLLVHPWLTQGSALLQSYTPPVVTSNVSNVWEMTMVQDYLSISWPVIDATFRYSLFMYGALVCNAPMYCGLLGGLQKSDTTPYS